MNKIIELNAQTGEQILREMTEIELLKYEKEKEEFLKAFQAVKEAEATKALERSNLLERLGITEEEAKLLLS